MDNEKQIEEMFNIIVDGVIDGEDNNGVPTGNTCANIAKALYEAGYAKQPTADVQEVRHGRWIAYPSITISKRKRRIQSITYQCSCCGKSNGRAKSPYCPNCGSKMCGDESEAKIKEVEEKK